MRCCCTDHLSQSRTIWVWNSYAMFSHLLGCGKFMTWFSQQEFQQGVEKGDEENLSIEEKEELIILLIRKEIGYNRIQQMSRGIFYCLYFYYRIISYPLRRCIGGETAFVHFVNTFPIPFCSTLSVLNISMEWTLKIVLSDELFELDAGIRKQVVSFAEQKYCMFCKTLVD